MGRTTHEREVTILFTDVEGSTELRSRRGDQVADEILAIHEAIVRRAIEEHGGQEALFLGDGFMAAFATPSRGLACAIDIQRRLDEHNRANPERQVRVRAGLHLGEVTERDGTLYGQTVHAAARVASEAAGGQILVSSVVRELAAGQLDVSFRDRGLYWLKGFPERWRLHEVEWGRGTPPPPSGAAAAGRARTPFVEREMERADLRRAIDSALAGRGRLVLLAGEAGVGKTRLAQEVTAEAEGRGMRVVVGHCVEMEGAPPYLPFVEIIEEMLVAPRSPKALREALGDAAAEIARIVPALRRVIEGLGAPLDLPPEQARRYLWVSVQQFLERAAAIRPLMLVLDDLHWADESTLFLLEHLAPHLWEMPVLVVGTYRDVEVGVSHPLARVVNQLARRRLVGRIHLRRLSERGVAAMVRGLSGQKPPESLVRAMFSESEGNPFFVEEVYLHLAESGRLLDEQGRFRRDLRIDELDVPMSVRLVVGERLSRLSEGTREILGAAAVLGRVFAPQLVEAVASTFPDELMESLDEAERARLVEPADGVAGRLAFSHELIRQTLLADISSVKRQRLHGQAADAIERVHAGDLEAHAADLAYQLTRAGPADPSRLVRYLSIAGDRALEAAAFEDAVAHFEHALPLIGSEDRESRAAFLERLAMALRSVGRWDEALQAMDESLALYEALGWTEDIGRLCWAMVYHLGWGARFPEAMAVVARGLGALGDLPNPDRARLLSAGGWILGLGGDHDSAAQMFRDALQISEPLGDARALADVLHLKTIHHMSYAQFPPGIETGLRAAEVFEAEGALWDLCSVLTFVLYQAGTMGRVEQAAELAARAGPLAERLGHLGAAFLVLADRLRTHGILPGDLAAIETIAREQLDVCERGALPWIYVGHLYLGLAAHWRGDWEEAERELRRAVQLEPPAAFAGQSASILAMHLALAGRPEEALAILEERRPAMPVSGRVNSLGTWNTMFGLTEAAYLAGRPQEAAAFLPLIEEALALGEWVTFDCRTIHTRAGIAAAAAGEWDLAERRYLEATEIADELGNRIELADLRRFQARMMLERNRPGDPERARELLKSAAASYAEMGMARHATMADAMLADASA